MIKEKITELNKSIIDEEVDEVKDDDCIPEGAITEIDTFVYGHFALGDRVYYIRPFCMHKIKSGTIKQFIWKCDDLMFPDYDIVLDNGDVLRDSDLFRTLAAVRAEVIERLKSSIVNERNRLVGLQRRIAINERRLATLENYDKKIRNQSTTMV